MFRALEPERIIDTIRKLQHRIDERFPARSGVSAELGELGRDTEALIRWLRRPIWPIAGLFDLCEECSPCTRLLPLKARRS